MIKQEILDAISNITIDCSDFDHVYDWSKRTYAKCTKYVESDNFNITIEFEEECRWNAPDDTERVNMAISGLIITDENGKEIDIDIKDEEILNLLQL